MWRWEHVMHYGFVLTYLILHIKWPTTHCAFGASFQWMVVIYFLCSVPVNRSCCVTRCTFLLLVKVKACQGDDRTHRPHGRVTHNLMISVISRGLCCVWCVYEPDWYQWQWSDSSRVFSPWRSLCRLWNNVGGIYLMNIFLNKLPLSILPICETSSIVIKFAGQQARHI